MVEAHTLKLRPVGVRIFVENPPDSGKWSKIRVWKDDGSLQSVLVQEFFEGRRRDGIVTRVEVRDGADRLAEGDAMSLRSVGSRIFHPRERAERSDSMSTAPKPKARRIGVISWLGLGKAAKSEPQGEVPEEHQELMEAAPQKVGAVNFSPAPFFLFRNRQTTSAATPPAA